MSSFCGTGTTAPVMTAQEMRAPFSMPGKTPLLPSSLPSLNENGLVDENWLRNYVTSLESSGRIPVPPQTKDLQSVPFGSPDSKDPLAQYTAKEQELHESIRAEYCFYERQYFSALDSFLTGLADSSLRGNQTNIQERLDLARQTNQRVTVFTQIVNAISKYRYTSSQRWQQDINQLNAEFRKRGIILAEQAAMLRKESASADLHKRMVDYTLEKNKANSNLLSLYVVLNVSAIAILVYLSRTQ
jgi:hypothetical protein